MKKKNFNVIFFGSHPRNRLLAQSVGLKKYHDLDFEKKIGNFYDLFILCKNLFYLYYLKNGFFFFYSICKIREEKPKFIITFYDNDIRFYLLKKFFPETKFISIQNGYRFKNHGIFGDERLIKKSKIKIDYIFVFSDGFKKLYSNYFDGKIIVSGSFLNNFEKIKTFKRNGFCYISQAVKKSIKLKNDNFSSEIKLTKIDKKIILFREKALKILFRYCKENGISFYILGKSIDNSKIEKDYYLDLFKNKKFIYISKKNHSHGYKILEKFDLLFTFDSTLGYEALSRDNKVVFFNNKQKLILKKKNINVNVFWPYEKIFKEQLYLIDDLNYQNFEEKINFFKKYNHSKYLKIFRKKNQKILFYDNGNKILLSTIKKLLISKL